MTELITCKNCGHRFHGKFCSNCGEKVYTRNDKTFAHIFEEAIHFLTHFEGKFLLTLKTVFIQPGKFSYDYCDGIRKKYFKPVSLFFLLVILYLLFPFFKGLNMKLNTYINEKNGFNWIAVPMVNEKMNKNNYSYNIVSERYDAKSSSVSKVGLFSLIPLTALVLFLLFYTSKKYFFDHFILSLELCSVFIAIHYLIIPFFSFIVISINKNGERFFWDDNIWLKSIIFAVDIYFVFRAFKFFYRQHWAWTLLKTILYIFVFGIFVFYLYRLLVLVTTLLFI